MSRYACRWSKCSGSTKQLIARILARGWEPGLRVRDFMPARKHRRQAEGGAR